MGVGGLYNGSAYSTDASPCTGYTAIAGYWPGSDVTEHNKIDLDQHAITTSLKSGDFVSAKTMYTTGANSQGSNGFRTLQGFSTSAQAKMYEGCAGCPYEHYSRFFNYYGDYNYADKWVLAALDGTATSFSSGRGDADFSDVNDVATRREAVKKGTSYMNVWMYAIREFEDAIDDCLTCTSNCNEHSNYNAVHAWDEGVAFYTGSLEGTDLGGTSAGEMPYRLAEKRCANFKTCGSKGDSTTGISKVNSDLFELFLEGEMLLSAGKCASVRPIVDQIVSKMTIPLVQGTLRYAYKVGSGSDSGLKAKAEGAVFAASVLPLVHYCDSLSDESTATTIYDNMGVGAASTGFAAVKSAFESNYGCLGISCAEVGGLYNGSAYSTDASPCTGYTAIAGYWPGSDVTEHNKIDLDQHAITTSLKSGDFVSAKTMYTTGANSQGSNGFRTLQGFSTSAQAKMYEGCAGCPYEHYTMFYNYYGDFHYADKWVLAALDGTGTAFSSGHGDADFSVVNDVATRVEAVKKGTSYMNVWMYVIREFEDAIDDCLTCTSNCNEHSNYNSVHAWDEGVAFYTGSLEGTDLGGTSAGEMPYRLAEKRCANFKTCGSTGDSTTGISKVNSDLFELFLEGEVLLSAGDCSAVRPIVDQIVSKMTIPLVQGTLRYAYKVSSGSDDGPKAKAEGAVFVASVLPLVNHCNPGSASTIFSNMRVGASSTTWSDVKSAFESNYACLGISCAEVGGLWDGSKYSAFASPCSEEVATLDSAVTITSNQAPEYFDEPDVRARIISEYARKVGVSESAVNFVVKQSASRLRARSLQVATSYNIVFTITCQASCDAVAASVPSTQSEATAVFDAANVDAEALSDPVQTLPSPPPPSPPSPPTTSDCLGTGNTNIPPP